MDTDPLHPSAILSSISVFLNASQPPTPGPSAISMPSLSRIFNLSHQIFISAPGHVQAIFIPLRNKGKEAKPGNFRLLGLLLPHSLPLVPAFGARLPRAAHSLVPVSTDSLPSFQALLPPCLRVSPDSALVRLSPAGHMSSYVKAISPPLLYLQCPEQSRCCGRLVNMLWNACTSGDVYFNETYEGRRPRLTSRLG